MGDEDELADFLLMEEMSEAVPGHFPFVAHDESSNDSTFSSVSQAGKSKLKSESIGEYMALAASLDRVLRQVNLLGISSRLGFNRIFCYFSLTQSFWPRKMKCPRNLRVVKM